MTVLDFLFQGKPPQSVTTYGQTVENMPKWLSDYTQGMIAKANAVAAEPYQPYQGPRIAGFSPDQLSAHDITRQNAGSYIPGMNLAMDYASSAGGTSPLALASPYLNMASRTFPGASSEYMDPYIENVINRGTLAANRNFSENIMPMLSDTFTRSGQYGSSAHMREADRAARDLTEGIQSQALAALSGAYQNAGQMFGQDASRMGALAQTAGQLAGTEGQLKLGASQNMGTLAQMLQNLGIRDAASLEAIGSQYQGLGQKNLDLAYKDFEDQTNYPRQTIDWMSSVIRGLPAPTTTQTSNTGPSSVYQPSPLSQLASLMTGLQGWNEANK